MATMKGFGKCSGFRVRGPGEKKVPKIESDGSDQNRAVRELSFF
jgi:hypothetical protein